MDSRAQCNCPEGSRSPIGAPLPTVGNPVALNYSAKIDREVDYLTNDGRFGVVRKYYSLPDDAANIAATIEVAGFGARWHGVLPGRLVLYGNDNADYIQYMDAEGGFDNFRSEVYWDQSNWKWSPKQAGNRRRLSMVSIPTVTRKEYFFNQPAVQNGPGEVRMEMSQGEYILFRRSKATGAGGRFLVPVEHGYADGYRIFYQYPDDGEFASSITDSFGRQMTLSWELAQRQSHMWLSTSQPIKVVKEIGLPDGTRLIYTYGYDTDRYGSKVKDRLQSIRRVSLSGTELWGRTILYENPSVPYAMTGKLNLAGQRLSTYDYDAAGLVKQTQQAGGVNRYQIENTEDEGSSKFYRVVTGPLGYQQKFTFHKDHPWDDAQRVLKRVEGYAAAGVEATAQDYAYHGYVGDFAIAEYSDAKGRRTTFSIDGGLRPTVANEAVGTADARSIGYSWHPVFDLPTRIVREGLTTDYTYSSTGQLLSETQTDTTAQTVPYSTSGQTRTKSYTWTPGGRLASIDGPKGPDANGRNDVDTFSYDSAGNLLTATNAVGHVTTFSAYDANGRPGKMVDANGISTIFGYDGLGRLISSTVKHPSNSVWDVVSSFGYDNEGNVTEITLPATDKILVDYDLANRAIAIRSTSGDRIDITYDAMSNVTAQTIKRSNGSSAASISRTFDALGRMVTEATGADRTRRWAYDKVGNATTVTSARSTATQQAFDALDRLVSKIAPDSGVATTSFDQKDNEVSFKDAKGVQTNFVRNGFGEVIQEISPDRGTSIFYYDQAGGRVSEIDGRGQRIDYQRDALGRIVKATPVGRSASEISTYIWDAAPLGGYGKGRLASVTDGTGITRFKYNHRGKLWVKQQAIGTSSATTLEYAYDLADRITSIKYPSGRLVTYVRDTKGRVSMVKTRPSVNGTDVTLVSGMTYEPFGALVSATFGNGLKLSQGWGNDARLASRRLYRGSDGSNVSWLTYGYDRNDNITLITDRIDATRTTNFLYDLADRLSRSVAASGSPARFDYVHDVNGNRTRVEARLNATDATPSAITDYALNAGTNRLASVTDPAGLRTISYDGRGNTSSETRSGNVAISVDYDGFGRLISYAQSGNGTLSHSYNALGDRVSTSTPMEVRRFIYDADGRMFGEYGGSLGDQKAETIWLSPEVGNDNQPWGGSDGSGGYAPLAVVTGNGSIYWTYANHLGVPVISTDSSGAAVTLQGLTQLGFPGQTKTYGSLYYNRYRDYDSTTGRYIQADPIGLRGGQNSYVYAYNNPLRFIDPKGKNAAAIVIFAPEIAIPIIIYALYQAYISYEDCNVPSILEMGKKSGKEKSSDYPSWADQYQKDPGEDCHDFAKAILDDKYGVGNWDVSDGEYSKIVKACYRGGYWD